MPRSKPSSSSPIYPGERQAEAIHEAKKLAHEAHMSGQAVRDALRHLEEHLYTIRSTDDDPKLARLIERVQDLHYKLNAMELGAFMIGVGNVLDEAWRRLP